jgi:hypothetical protein
VVVLAASIGPCSAIWPSERHEGPAADICTKMGGMRLVLCRVCCSLRLNVTAFEYSCSVLLLHPQAVWSACVSL